MIWRLRENSSAYVVIAGLMIVAVWIATINSVQNERQDRQAIDRARALETATMLEAHVTHVFAYGDTYLKAARHEYLRHGSLQELRSFLLDTPPNAALLSHITVIDATGKPIFISTGDALKPDVSAADRDYFKALQSSPGDSIYISEPALGRNSGLLTIRFARRIELQPGQFDGLIFTSVQVNQFTDLFSSLDLGRNSVVGLVGLDRKVRVWLEKGQGKTELQPNDWAIWAKLAEAPSGIFRETGSNEALKRDLAYRRVVGYPLIAIVGIAGVDMIEATFAFTASAILMALLITLIIVVLTSSILRDVRMMRTLEREVAVRRRAEADAIHATEIKTAFLATMSHEIRTPINAIMGLFELIEQADVPERQKRQASAGQTAAGDLFKQLTNVLDASRLEAKSLELTMRVEPLTPIIAALSQLLEAAIKASGKPIQFATHVAANVPATLRMDRRRVEQIVMNFIDNAVKFTESGRIDIEVSVDMAKPTPVLCFAVRDTGLGMSTKGQARLFKRFSQLDSAMTRRAGGAGLGLSISKDLAELMQATLKVDSRDGYGSCFCLMLPFE